MAVQRPDDDADLPALHRGRHNAVRSHAAHSGELFFWITVRFFFSFLHPAHSRARYEFATVVRHYWGARAYWVFQILYNLSMQASNIASMIISAQVCNPCWPCLWILSGGLHVG